METLFDPGFFLYVGLWAIAVCPILFFLWRSARRHGIADDDGRKPVPARVDCVQGGAEPAGSGENSPGVGGR